MIKREAVAAEQLQSAKNDEKEYKIELDWPNILRFNYFYYGLIVGFPFELVTFWRFLFCE
jgi:hypothetical protein